MLPIVPAYLSIITGLEVGEISEGKEHLRRIARDTGLFIAGEDDPGTTEATAFDLPAIQGHERIRLADFAGTPTVVNFFAPWCTACDAELPGFAKVSRELQGQVSFIGVNSLETGDAMLMPERHGITWWPLARDTGGRNGSGLHAAPGGRGMPITAFYDADGSLLHVDGGALPERLLRTRLNELYEVDV